MDQPRTYKLIGMPILIALIISGFMMFLSSGSTQYEMDYNSSAMEKIKESGEQFKSVSSDVDSNLSSSTVTSDDFDKSGSILKQALDSLNTVTNSFSLFGDLFDASFENMGLGEYSRVIKTSLFALITLIIILGIITTAALRVRV